MTDRPILFSGPMVRALLDGRKTQTRRVLKPQPVSVDESGRWYRMESGGASLNCYGQPFAPGDRLWVRETWAVAPIYDGVRPREINPGGKPGWCGIRYAATDHRKGIKDRPSIFMPRWASRLTLQVTDVRVLRLQEISDEDALAEGVEAAIRPMAGRDVDIDGFFWPGGPARMFRDLWGSLNGKRGYGWEENPWVVAVSFDVHRQNIDQSGEDA